MRGVGSDVAFNSRARNFSRTEFLTGSLQVFLKLMYSFSPLNLIGMEIKINGNINGSSYLSYI